MTNKTLSDEVMNSTVFLGRLTQGTFDLDDVKESINKTLKELTVENPDTINEYSNRRILESFKKNFGDALVATGEGGQNDDN